MGLTASLAPQWAHADPPGPQHKAPTTTISNLAVPKATARQNPQPRTEKAPGGSASTRSAPAETKVIADLPSQATKQFSTIGVTWLPDSKAADAKVEVRTKAVGGTWTDWSALDSDSDAAPEAAKRVGTAPTFVGESDGVQVRVTGTDASDLRDVQLTLIDSPEVASDANPQTMAAQSDATAASIPRLYPRPSIVTRKGWGADESLRSYNGKDCATPKIDPTIKAAVIHHTAGSNSYSSGQSASIVRGIYAYHVKTNGWCDIGYNYLVDRYGKIFEGRFGGIYYPVHGAHATKWNTDTTGVSLMGNFQSAHPTSAMINSTEKLIAWKLESYYRNPKSKVTLAGKTEYRIFSHGDVMQTECPGKTVHAMLGAIRDNVAAKIGSYASPSYNKWQSLGGEGGWVGSPYVGERALANGGRYTRFLGANIYYRSDVGAHYVRGSIRVAHDKYGGVSGNIGYPTTDEINGKSTGSKVTYFTGGRIYWGSGLGAHPVRGAIGARYQAMGEDGSRLGLPIHDEANGPLTGSRVQTFQHATMLWSGKTNAWPVWGRIRTRYLGFSTKVKGYLGLPVAMEAPSKVRGVSQKFSNGMMYWDTHEAYAVWGDLGRKYVSLGGEQSRLGFPTSNPYGVSGGAACNFEHGKITWNSKTGVSTVTYN